MLIRNVDVTDGLANGSQGTVIDFIRKNNTVVAVLVKFDSPKVGENARRDSRFDLKKYEHGGTPIERISVKFSYIGSNIKITRLQFPLKLAWACSIHKVQGLTLTDIVISFEDSFRDGHAYVALSRVKTLDGLYLNKFTEKKIKASTDVKNEIKRLKECALLQSPLCNSTQTNTDVCKIVLLNARSAKLHFLDITNHPLVNASDIICLSETHFTINQRKNYQIPDFELSILPSSNTCHGLATYTHSNVGSMECQVNSGVESLKIELEHDKIQHLQLIYRSPSSSVADFHKSLTDLIDFDQKPDIILGDFNMDIHTSAYKTLVSAMNQHHYKQLVDDSTHNSGSTLDLVFVPEDHCYDIKLFATYFSDHKIVSIVKY